MRKPVIGRSIYLLPGMRAEILAPGYFIETAASLEVDDGEQGEGVKTVPLLNGFWVEDTDVGEITEATDGGIGVIYTHKKAGANAIWFETRTGQTGLVNIISVPIHDHSSIVQGGPAYGTYFTDDDAQDAE